MGTWEIIGNSPLAARVSGVVGANDMEMDWNSSAMTRVWSEGYDSVPGRIGYYNYGDAGGCPQQGTISNGSCNNNWTQEDVWYVSYGVASAFPLPEIYLTGSSGCPACNARQWQQLSLYGDLIHGYRMNIAGTTTQHGACQVTMACPETNNTPREGWLQLYYWLRTDERTWQDTLQYSTDITW